ncbi:MAG: enoyl-CoA hydratase/isomerase family protein [Acidimicrobiia bacterium]
MDPAPTLVLRTDLDAVVTLTLNRPEKLNALTPALFVELRAQLEAIAAAGDEVACVVLAGAGRCFSAGNDLDALAAGQLAPTPTFQADTIDLLESIPQPVIGKIHGHCLTGALELALGCDFLIVGESASFSDTHGRWGLVPAWGMSIRLPERVGRATAKELMYTGRRVDGHEAVRLGLANRCVPDADLDRTVEEITAQIAANSRGTIKREKWLVRDSATMPRDQALARERVRPYGKPEDRDERLKR